MNYTEFLNVMTEEVKIALGEEISVHLREVHKNNGVLLQGLTITSKQSNLSPTIYLNSFFKEYEQGKSVQQLRDDILDIYHSSKIEYDVDMDFFLDYEKVKNNLYCRLINFDRNTDFLEDVPYRKQFDLAMICFFSCEREHLNQGFITITTQHLDTWGISEEELFETAWANTREKHPYMFFSMEQLLRQLIEADVRRNLSCQEEELEDKEAWISFTVEQILQGILADRKRSQMYVLTIEGKVWGSIGMLWQDALAELANQLDSDLFILPSSIHEVIVVPADGEDSCQSLSAMVAEINKTHVEPEEVLSDHIYRYLKDSGTTILQ